MKPNPEEKVINGIDIHNEKTRSEIWPKIENSDNFNTATHGEGIRGSIEYDALRDTLNNIFESMVKNKAENTQIGTERTGVSHAGMHERQNVTALDKMNGSVKDVARCLTDEFLTLIYKEVKEQSNRHKSEQNVYYGKMMKVRINNLVQKHNPNP